MNFIDAFDKLAFSSEVSVELPNMNRSTNSGSEREKQYYHKTFLQYLKGYNVGCYSDGSAGKNELQIQLQGYISIMNLYSLENCD